MLAWIFVVITLIAADTPAGWDVAEKARVHGPFATEGACAAAREALAARVAGRPVSVGFCVPKDPGAIAVIRERGLFVTEPALQAREAP